MRPHAATPARAAIPIPNRIDMASFYESAASPPLALVLTETTLSENTDAIAAAKRFLSQQADPGAVPRL